MYSQCIDVPVGGLVVTAIVSVRLVLPCHECYPPVTGATLLRQVAIRSRQFLDSFTSLPDCPVDVWISSIVAEVVRTARRVDVDGGSACGSGSVNSTGSASGGGGASGGSEGVGWIGIPRVRRLFEQALASRRGQHVVLIWRLYVRFELCSGNPMGAKKALLRAVNRCAHLIWFLSIRFGGR